MKLRVRLLAEWGLIALLASTAIMFAILWRGTVSFDNLFYDQLSSVSRPAADKDILIVAIDDPSLQALGEWPWPRQNHAALIEKLAASEPRSILFDVLLSEPSEPTQDAALGSAMSGKVPVFIPMHFVTPGEAGRAYDPVMPIPLLAQVASGIGHVNVEFDSDGTVRRAALCFQPDTSGQRWPHIVELVARTQGKPTASYRRIVDCNQTILIPFVSRGSFAQISYADVLNGNVPDSLLRGRDVIIGATATGMRDSYPVPYGDGGLLSGAEIMANMLTALKQDNFIKPFPIWSTIILSLAPTWILLLGFLRWQPRVALTASVLTVAIILAVSAGALSAKLWFPPGAALLGIFLVYPLWGWRRLQAISEFMKRELGELEREGEIIPPLPKSQMPDDLVGRQSEALAGAIDHMRDLRRFVADTIEHMPDPLFVTDLDGVVTLTNDLLDECLQRDVTGMMLRDVLDNIVLPTHRRAVDAYLVAARSTSQTDATESKQFIRFDALNDRTFVMRTADVQTDADVLRGHIHYLTDITDLAKAEGDREVALQLLSHDMRAPQSAIIAILPDIRNAKASARIEGHARRTMQLAQDFVDIARMGESQFEGEDVLLPDLLRDVADNFWPLAKERGIVISVIDESDDGFVFAEPDSLSRAVSNLVDNAIKYSPNGGQVIIKVGRTQLKSQEMLTIAIDDQGAGIDPELAPRLFERFASRGGGKGRVKGIGLGLTFVRAVAERHNGMVTASNRDIGGARFIMTLPEAPALTDG